MIMKKPFEEALWFHFEESTFQVEKDQVRFVFLVYDWTNKIIRNVRIGKSKASRTDKLRTILSAVKKCLSIQNQKEGQAFFIQTTRCIFSEKSLDFVPRISRSQVIESYIKLFSEMNKDTRVKPSAVLKAFNSDSMQTASSMPSIGKVLSGRVQESQRKSEDEWIVFINCQIDRAKELLDIEIETIFYIRKKVAYLKYLDWFYEQKIDKQEIDNIGNRKDVKHALSSFEIKSKQFKKDTNNCAFSIFSKKWSCFFVPNSSEIKSIFFHGGMSLKNRVEYLSSLLKFSFFCLYYLGLDVDKIFVIKKSDLITITDKGLITLNLDQNKKVTRTILSDTREVFVSLAEDMKVLFEDSDQIVQKNCNFNTKNLSFILNRDLKVISKRFFVNKFTVKSLKNSAYLRLLKVYPTWYVLKEFEITESFAKRLERFYQAKFL